MLRALLTSSAVALALAAGCGGAATAEKSAPAAPSGGAAAGASGTSDFPPSVGAARSDFDREEHEVQLASSDCQAACKALASMERAADRLCLVAEPQECSDARVRVDRAKRAISAQCGGC